MPSRAGIPHYSREEDEILIRLANQGAGRDELAPAVGRTPNSVGSRVYILRSLGLIKSAAELREAARKPEKPLAAPVPPLVLDHDQALVLACRAEGGFPRAVVVGEQTVWADRSGRLWKHTPPAERLAA